MPTNGCESPQAYTAQQNSQIKIRIGEVVPNEGETMYPHNEHLPRARIAERQNEVEHYIELRRLPVSRSGLAGRRKDCKWEVTR